jgi:hypothetical protein
MPLYFEWDDVRRVVLWWRKGTRPCEWMAVEQVSSTYE